MKLKDLEKLPEDVVGVIGQFLPLQIAVFLNRKNYENNQTYISQNCDNKNIRKIIRNDYNYLFYHKLKFNYKRWKKLRKWVYKNQIFPTFNVYLRYLCVEYGSSKCKETLDIYEKEIGSFRKNKFKNIRSIRCRWSN